MLIKIILKRLKKILRNLKNQIKEVLKNLMLENLIEIFLALKKYIHIIKEIEA